MTHENHFKKIKIFVLKKKYNKNKWNADHRKLIIEINSLFHWLLPTDVDHEVSGFIDGKSGGLR